MNTSALSLVHSLLGSNTGTAYSVGDTTWKGGFVLSQGERDAQPLAELSLACILVAFLIFVTLEC